MTGNELNCLHMIENARVKNNNQFVRVHERAGVGFVGL